MEDRGLEPLTFWLPASEQADISSEIIPLTESTSSACTSACTSEANSVNAAGVDADHVDTLKAISAAISNLSPEDRARLSMMLSDKES